MPRHAGLARTPSQPLSLRSVVGRARRDVMVERVARSAAGSPLPRWGRRLLLAAAAGAGVWLLGCCGHQASAQAETASPRPVVPVNAADSGTARSPAQPVMANSPAGRIRFAVMRLDPAGRDGLVRAVPALPPLPMVRPAVGMVPIGLLPVSPVGSALLPPARSRETGAAPGPAGPGGRQAPDAHQPGSRPAEPGLSVVAIAEPVAHNVAAAVTEPAPRPRPLPIPGPGLPVLPAGAVSQAPGSPNSLPLAEPVAGLAPNPAGGLTSAGAAGAADAPQRVCLPDTPPG